MTPSPAAVTAGKLFEQRARAKKAEAIARTIWEATVRTFEDFENANWRAAVNGAKEMNASRETQAEVLRILKSMRPIREGW